MKKLTTFVIFLLQVTYLNAQTSSDRTLLKDLLLAKDGKIYLGSGFKQHILPHITPTASLTNSKKKITPKSYVLKSTETLRDIILDYHIVAIDLSDIGCLVSNQLEGSFDSVFLKKDAGNVIFVMYQQEGKNYAEGYVIDIFFSPQLKLWYLNAHPMALDMTIKKGVQIITY